MMPLLTVVQLGQMLECDFMPDGWDSRRWENVCSCGGWYTPDCKVSNGKMSTSKNGLLIESA